MKSVSNYWQRIEYISMKKNNLIVNRVKKKEKKNNRKEKIEKHLIETKIEKSQRN